MDIDQLERQIEEAFPADYPPDGVHLARVGRWFDESGKLQEYVNPEGLDAQAFFQGKPWHDFVGEPLINLGGRPFSILAFLNPHARAYYLPAFMLTALHSYHENGDLVEGLFNRLTPPKCVWLNEEEREDVLAVIDKCADLLSTEQKNSLKEETFKRKDFGSLLQRDAVMQSLEQDYEDFINALTPAQKRVIREFILYMRKINEVEDLAEMALRGCWSNVAA
jgi:hypothetical protein